MTDYQLINIFFDLILIGQTISQLHILLVIQPLDLTSSGFFLYLSETIPYSNLNIRIETTAEAKRLTKMLWFLFLWLVMDKVWATFPLYSYHG